VTETRRVDLALILGAVLLAFSPVIADVATHLVREPWARYCLVFPPLAVLATRASQWQLPASRIGLVAIGVAVLIELFCLVAGLPRFGRVGLLLGVCGALVSAGALAPAALPLVLLSVPVPFALFRPFAPEVPRALATATAAVARRVGVDATALGTRLLDANGSELFGFLPQDVGLPTGLLLAGLAWYAGVRAHRPSGATLRAAVVWGAAGCVAHWVVAIAEALATAQRGGDPFGLPWATWLWLGAAVIGVGCAERNARTLALSGGR
jgi:hypothetical protein